MLLNNQLVNMKIKKKIKQYLERKENGNTANKIYGIQQKQS